MSGTMKQGQSPNSQALLRAIYATKPEAITPAVLSMSPHTLESVTFTVELTPALIQAWSAECAKANKVMREPVPRPEPEGDPL